MARSRSHSMRQRCEPSRLNKATLLVEGQSTEFIFDTGFAVTKMPQVINPSDLNETVKCFVDVKTPIKFKGEAMAHVKAEKHK